MCGIVGLFLKNPSLEPRLGGLVAPMLETMTDRGPDSAGFAVYGAAEPGRVKLTLRVEGGIGASQRVVAGLETALGLPVATVARDTHLVVSLPESAIDAAWAWLAAHERVRTIGAGRRMELYKGVGAPAAVSRRFELAAMGGTHAIGHTRMATESAVTTDGATPTRPGSISASCTTAPCPTTTRSGARWRARGSALRPRTTPRSRPAT